MVLTTSIGQVTTDVVRLRHLFVNVYFIGNTENWILVDAALAGSTSASVAAAEQQFGSEAKPSGIVLTHGHFDHVGPLPDLLEQWDVPVWAPPLEVPHLTGREDYPPPDPTVGKGARALLSFAYPNKAVDLGTHVRALQLDNVVPQMPDWCWAHTPGHTKGHISLYRGRDGVLVAGDTFVTVEQESLYKVMTQKQEVHGPAAYFTPDWKESEESVRILRAIQPTVDATGHGTPMEGEALTAGLAKLVAQFEDIAVPDRGRYVTSD